MNNLPIIVGSIAAVTIGIAAFLKSSIRAKVIPALVFSVFLMICSGSLPKALGG